jgi:hypothetical protein
MCHFHYRFLGGLLGGKKSANQQREMAVDLSKFQCHTTDTLALENVVKMKAVQTYIDHLQERKIGPSGTISKLTIPGYAQKFIIQW